MESSKKTAHFTGIVRAMAGVLGGLFILFGAAGVVLSVVAGFAFLEVFALVIIVGLLMITVSVIQMIRSFIPAGGWRNHRARLFVSALYFLVGVLILISLFEISTIFVVLFSVGLIILSAVAIGIAFSRYVGRDMVRLLIIGSIMIAIGLVVILQAIFTSADGNGLERFGVISSLSVMVIGWGLLAFALRSHFSVSGKNARTDTPEKFLKMPSS